MTRAVVVIDGEHYAPVVRDALAALPYEVTGVWMAGGTEKLRGGEDYGVPVVEDFRGADVVVDLSDEPVMSATKRFRLASDVLAQGLPYVGPDFRFDPPVFEPFPLPSIAVIGTGKRVGKTAVTGHVARRLAREREVVVVAMGRGGPAEPEVIESAPTVAELLELSRTGRHAASDHLETAVAAGVVTIGCRRAGGGLAGMVTASNVSAGARLAAARSPEVVVFDGSGAAIPPVAADRRILVVGPGQDATAHLNAYRVLISDVVVALDRPDADAIRAIKEVPVLQVELRLRPLEPLAGRRTAVFTTGAAPTGHLDADVVAVSQNLADRARLRDDLDGVDADVYLIEVKAAAIDVVAETAAQRGVDVVLAVNDVVSDELDEVLAELVPEVARV
ncbi:MAG: 2,3-diphosphoglycerate synthetase [Gaiellaceae bacterium]|jgi:cyclic 2,3-diphosphoglycerate synthase